MTERAPSLSMTIVEDHASGREPAMSVEFIRRSLLRSGGDEPLDRLISDVAGLLCERRLSLTAESLIRECLSTSEPFKSAGAAKVVRHRVLQNVDDGMALFADLEAADVVFEAHELEKLGGILTERERFDRARELLDHCERRGMGLTLELKLISLRCVAAEPVPDRIDEMMRQFRAFELPGEPWLKGRALVVEALCRADRLEEARGLLPALTPSAGVQLIWGTFLFELARESPGDARRELIALYETGIRILGRVFGRVVLTILANDVEFGGVSGAVDSLAMLEDAGYRPIDRVSELLIDSAGRQRDTAGIRSLLTGLSTRQWPLSETLLFRLARLVLAAGDDDLVEGLLRLAHDRRLTLSESDWERMLERCRVRGDASRARTVISRMVSTGVNPSRRHFELVADSYTGTLSDVGETFRRRLAEWNPGPPPEIAGVLLLSVLEVYARTRQTDQLRFVVGKFEGWRVLYSEADLSRILLAAASVGDVHLDRVIEQFSSPEPWPVDLPRLSSAALEPVALDLVRRGVPGLVEAKVGSLIPDLEDFEFLQRVYRARRIENRAMRKIRSTDRFRRTSKPKDGGRPLSAELAEHRFAAEHGQLQGEFEVLQLLHTELGRKRTVGGLLAALEELERNWSVPDEIFELMFTVGGNRWGDVKDRWEWTRRCFQRRERQIPARAFAALIWKLEFIHKAEEARTLLLERVAAEPDPSKPFLAVEVCQQYLATRSASRQNEVFSALLRPRNGLVSADRLLVAIHSVLLAENRNEDAQEELENFAARGVRFLPEIWTATLQAHSQEIDDLWSTFRVIRQRADEASPLDSSHYLFVVGRLIVAGRFDDVEAVRGWVENERLDLWANVTNRLIVARASWGDVDEAERLLSDLERRGQLPESVARRALLAAQVRSGRHVDRELVGEQAVTGLGSWVALFMRDLSHELNNRLHALDMAIQNLRDVAVLKPEATVEYVSDVEKVSISLRHLRERWDEFASPPDTGFADGLVDISAVVDGVIEGVRTDGLNSGIDIAKRIVPPSGERHLLVAIEHQLLDIVLRNLVRNAIQWVSKVDSPEIRIEALHVRQLPDRPSPAGGWVQILVRDNGPGVAPEIRRSLFQTGVSTRLGSGVGRGLAMTRLILSNVAGDITLRSVSAPEVEAGDALGPTFAEFQVLVPAGQIDEALRDASDHPEDGDWDTIDESRETNDRRKALSVDEQQWDESGFEEAD